MEPVLLGHNGSECQLTPSTAQRIVFQGVAKHLWQNVAKHVAQRHGRNILFKLPPKLSPTCILLIYTPFLGVKHTCVISSHDTTLFSVSIGFVWYIAISFGVMTPGLCVVGGDVKTGGFALS